MICRNVIEIERNQFQVINEKEIQNLIEMKGELKESHTKYRNNDESNSIDE